MKARYVVASLHMAAAFVAFAPEASADEVSDKVACVSSYEEAQTLRNNSQFLKARELLLMCSKPVCPKIVQRDCTKWLEDVDDQLPSVVVEARGRDARDATDVTVSIDGRVVATRLDGKAILVDPGVHKFRYEHEGDPAIEEQIVVREREKGRKLSVSWAPAQVTPPTSVTGERVSTPPRAPPKPQGPPVAAFVLGGIGAAGLVSFGVFAALGMMKRSDLSACKGQCSDSEVDSAKTRFLIADISLGAGAAFLAAGGIVWLVTRQKEEPRTVLGAAPTRNGALFTLNHTF